MCVLMPVSCLSVWLCVCARFFVFIECSFADNKISCTNRNISYIAVVTKWQGRFSLWCKCNLTTSMRACMTA